jgi:ABC-type amino acid transport substrate-binding protein
MSMPRPARLLYVDPFAPFSRRTEGQDAGVALDIVRAALGSQGLACEFCAAPLGDIRQWLEDGEADGIAAYGMSALRAPELDFSEPYLQTGGCLFLVHEGLSEAGSPRLRNLHIATPEPGPLGKYTQDAFPNAAVDLVADYSSALEHVREGRCQAAALNQHVGSWLSEELHPGVFVRTPMFVSVPLGLAVRQGTARQLLQVFAAGLQALDDQGTYEGFMKRLAATDSCPEVSWAELSLGGHGLPLQTGSVV